MPRPKKQHAADVIRMIPRFEVNTLMAAQPDFQEQKGCLQEELEAASQEELSSTLRHELNFIERFWFLHEITTLLQCKIIVIGPYGI
jgi:hypothetical protein